METIVLKRGYKYKLLPTKIQEKLLFDHCYNSNQAWNICVSLQQKEYQLNRNKKSLNSKLNIYSNEELKSRKVYLSDIYYDDIIKRILRKRQLNINTKVLQQTRRIFVNELKRKLKNIDKLRQEYYKTKPNKPFRLFNYKKSGKLGYNSFQTTKDQFTIKDYINPVTGKVNKKYKVIRIFKQEFKIRWTRELISEPKTVTFTYYGNEWFVSFTQIMKIENIKPNKKAKKIGIDINLDKIVLSSGKKINYNLVTKNIIKNNKKLKRMERKQSKRINKSLKTKTKLSKRYYKEQLKINKIHKKNRNIRNYNLHKIANELIKYLLLNKYKQINIEKLNVKSMLKKDKKFKNMKKNIQHSSFSMLINIIDYKCVQNGIIVKYIDPEYSSKLCSKCWHVNFNLQFEKTWICNKCNTKHDRDINAAVNIQEEKKLKDIQLRLKRPSKSS